MASDTSLNATLDDDAWKDSFDKLLEPREVLRQLNLLKKNVRASFNMDSSIESNSVEFRKASQKNSRTFKRKPKGQRAPTSISTPLGVRLSAGNPFKCPISPIDDWLRRSKTRTTSATAVQSQINESGPVEIFEATRINPEILIVDYDESQKQADKCVSAEQARPLEDSDLPLPRWLAKSPKPVKEKFSNRRVCFDLEEADKESQEILSTKDKESLLPKRTRQLDQIRSKSVTLAPGKWRKSLCLWRRTQQAPGQNQETFPRPEPVASALEESSVCYVSTTTVGGFRKSIYIKTEGDQSIVEPYRPSESMLHGDQWKARVLNYCKQKRPLPFGRVYEEAKVAPCRKIGEGAFGEVFLKSSQRKSSKTRREQTCQNTVLKVIPIEGNAEVNGEKQKTYEQILPEIIISVELSNLKFAQDGKNSTNGFVSITKVACVEGKYPAHFIKYWEEFDEEKGSENDHPEVFGREQLYVVLELEFSGCDLETYKFNSAEQSYYAMQQIVLTLAVAEEAYQFEHRDLHWGNILILPTTEKHLTYKLHGKEVTLPTKGVKTTIIDYTLSRMTYKDCCLYNDLACDEELFVATGDYQFDIYRMMRDILNNNWQLYEPKTNVFWISYIIAKMLDGVSYKSTKTKTHATYVRKFQELDKVILTFDSAVAFAKYLRKTI